MVDDICAIATPYGMGAISIIRCSGPNAISLVNNIFKGKNLENVASHTINYGYIYYNNEIVDEVLCNVFKAPKSFDGENTVEINCHGGVLVTNTILQILLKVGFRLAMRGEFSQRAFLNNKLDLTQAEAIMDIISSNNLLALKSSTKSLRSSTSNLIYEFRDKLLDLLAKIEVNIDYPEYEDSVDVTHDYLLSIIDDLMNNMQIILKNSSVSTLVIHGINTAIVGKPNVGKSSLLNMLLDEDKAIVSSIAGTTRDYVEGVLNVGNITLNVVDTAGIHESSDYVEAIGINRSEEAIKKADLILLVLDVSKPLDEIDYRLLELTKTKKRIIVANKNDLKAVNEINDAVYISALNHNGLDELIDAIYKVTNFNEFNLDDGRYLNNSRQVDLMQKAYDSLVSAKNAIENQVDIALIEIDIKECFDNLGRITGQAYSDELITALFSKFCLGK